MSVDIKEVDPAIVSSKTVAPPAQQVPKAPPPTFPPTAVIMPEEEIEAFNWETHVAVKCDGGIVSLPKDSAMALPFVASHLQGSPNTPAPFPFATHVMVFLNHWVEKKGCNSAVPQFHRPVLYTDMTLILTDDWDKHFFEKLLMKSGDAEYLIQTLNAAEKYGIPALHEFCLVGLSCVVRGETEVEVVKSLKQPPFAPEELSGVEKAYPWFNDVTKDH